MDTRLQKLIFENPAVFKVSKGEETLWLNPLKESFDAVKDSLSVTKEQIQDASDRLERFAPFIEEAFPETKESDGIIESPLREIENMKELLSQKFSTEIAGRLLLKMDSDLPIAGSVKARGGIYEVLHYTEKLALENGIITEDDNYKELIHHKDFFQKYAIHVGSTGNLGLSIGIMSAVIGYRVTVHMSREAKQWKKDKLRSYGVNVVEYDGDFTEAVHQGRALSDTDPMSYFVDDENSINLFMGYAVAAERLQRQLEDMDITIDEEHPLFVYLPCGVGGAPGGITFGLKHVFGDNVHCFFVEPTNCPSMLIGMASGLHNDISVYDMGLSGLTHADGLAVGRPSKLVGKLMEGLLSGVFTIDDYRLYDFLRDLDKSEQIFIEPSACAAFKGVLGLEEYLDGRAYVEDNELTELMDNAVHIAWATGGALVPNGERNEFLDTYL
ncbi:MAG: D-serine ammonia-lyase [Clostridia bacterium]|nr:D-serine ammonia-lyase [Clostridia bacterium]